MINWRKYVHKSLFSRLGKVYVEFLVLRLHKFRKSVCQYFIWLLLLFTFLSHLNYLWHELHLLFLVYSWIQILDCLTRSPCRLWTSLGWTWLSWLLLQLIIPLFCHKLLWHLFLWKLLSPSLDWSRLKTPLTFSIYLSNILNHFISLVDYVHKHTKFLSFFALQELPMHLSDMLGIFLFRFLLTRVSCWVLDTIHHIALLNLKLSITMSLSWAIEFIPLCLWIKLSQN